ncbi:MAG: lipid-A-disaccharide synthase [Kiritimatiellae bacterium]|nr:lipid-A-disaccharide synthase [Kiritimatiellia bacterium]
MTTKRVSIMLIAGEISGDMHAAKLVRAIQDRAPDTRFFGIGGDELAKTGMDILYHVREMAVMGLSEVLRKYRFFTRVLGEMEALAMRQRPDAVILVDYPGFNLRLARTAHPARIKVIYYICPQVWAWNRGRIPQMARAIDRLITIFPFEPDVFKDTGLKVDFVGHPLVEEANATLAEPPAELAWPGEPRIAILPGSRRHEVTRILPPMWAAAAHVARKYPEAGFIVAAPSEQVADLVRATLARLKRGPERWAIETGRTRQCLRQARAALIASGTATVEAALMRCPMVIAYRVSALTYLLGKLLVKVPHIGMVNIVARRRLCPELVQESCTPRALADALLPLLKDGPDRETMRAGLDEVAQSLGPGGAEQKAADIVFEELGLGEA